MRILFTSDLDRTLIFSERTKLEGVDYECIEQLDGRNISYVSKATFAQLLELQKVVDFVPVTTRSVEQYERLTLFQGELQPKLAILANGGVILRDGVVDEAWEYMIELEMRKLLLVREELPKHFMNWFNASFVSEVQEMDDLFFVLKVDRKQLVLEALHAFSNDLQRYGWTCYLQGRKLYITPRFLTKGRAVQFIKQQFYDWHAAAGDSLMDLSMLTLADKSFIPQHGELAKSTLHSLPVMQKRSSDYTESCLQQILEVLAKRY